MSDETTTEQLAEIEGQATDYTPPDGWRLLAVGEVLREGDEIVQSDDERRYPTKRVGSVVGANQRYIRPIEPQPEEQPEPQATDYTPPEGWRLVEVGEEVDIPGRDQYVIGPNRYIRPIEPQPEEQPEPQADTVQVRQGRWKTRDGEVKDVTAMPTDHDDFAAAYPWWDGQVSTWTHSGHLLSHGECTADLVEYLGPIEPEDKTQEPQPADTADELRSEIHYLQRELGEAKAEVAGLIQGRDLFAAANRRQADMIAELQNRIADLETINAAQKQAVERANRANDDLQNRLKAVAAEWAQQAETSRRLQIDLDAAQQVPADSPELRRANDKLAQLEVLQPMAAACSTAQTMVRDMLGHMRCLLALHHTTDRSNFCTLLESILEVFDDRECDDDGDETSDAEQV